MRWHTTDYTRIKAGLRTLAENNPGTVIIGNEGLIYYTDPAADQQGDITEAAVEPYWESEVDGYVARIEYVHDPGENIRFARSTLHDQLDQAYEWLREYGIGVGSP